MRRLLTVLITLLALPQAAAAAPDPLREKQWSLDMVRADAAHEITRGTGALVAVIDTGARFDHPDLAGRLVAGRDLVQDDGTPQDGNGHGTHVAGIVAANDDNGVGVSSVAPQSKVLVIRVLGDDGSGEAVDATRAVDLAVAAGADVINLSLSESVPLSALGFSDEEFDAAIRRAVDAGVVVVAAAGNNALPVCENPSVEGRLLCVGAVDKTGTRSFFSSFGDGLGLMGPGGSGLPFEGEDVLSTYTDPDYLEVAGTSQATPHVSGTAALLVSLGMRGQAAVKRIVSTAKDAGPPGPDSEYGAGIVDARAAVEGVAPTPGSPAARAAVRVPSPQRLGTVRRRGILVRCRVTRSGRCSARASYRGRTIARGSRRASPGRTVAFRARLTSAGRLALRGRARLRAGVRVALPGLRVTRRVTLRR